MSKIDYVTRAEDLAYEGVQDGRYSVIGRAIVLALLAIAQAIRELKS